MQVYKVTPEEQAAIEALNESRTAEFVIVCDLEDIGPCIVKDDIDEVKHTEYRKLLPTTLAIEKSVEAPDKSVIAIAK
jgi:hypothetical protein